MDFSALQQAASAAVAMAGQPVVLTPPGGTYDTATSTFTPNGVPITTTGVLIPLSRGLTHMPGSDIQVGDMELMLPGNIAQPPLNTTVQSGGDTYKIVDVAPVNAGGTGVYYDCVVRK